MVCNTCGKMNCYEHGGKIKLSKHHENNEHLYERDEGTSRQGSLVRSANRSKSWAKDERSSGPSIERSMAKDRMGEAREEAGERLEHTRSLPKPKLQGLAHGGEVEEMEEHHEGHDMDMDVDNELLDICAGELCDALERKDKKGILDAIRAIVLSCQE